MGFMSIAEFVASNFSEKYRCTKDPCNPDILAAQITECVPKYGKFAFLTEVRFGLRFWSSKLVTQLWQKNDFSYADKSDRNNPITSILKDPIYSGRFKEIEIIRLNENSKQITVRYYS